MRAALVWSWQKRSDARGCGHSDRGLDSGGVLHLLPIATSVEHGRPLTCWSGQNPGIVELAVLSALVGAAVGGGGEHAFLGSLQAEGQ